MSPSASLADLSRRAGAAMSLDMFVVLCWALTLFGGALIGYVLRDLRS